MENKSKRELNGANVINIQTCCYENSNESVFCINHCCDTCLIVCSILHIATHTVKKQEPKFSSKDQQRSAEENKGSKNHCMTYSM